MIERAVSTSNGAFGFRLGEGAIPALGGFDIGWQRSDHHVQWIAVGPQTSAPVDSGDYLCALRDRHPSGYPVSGTVKFEDLRDVARHLRVGGRDLRGEQRLRIPHLTSSEVLVLTGFVFSYGSSDHHLLEIKVHSMGHNDHIYVNFGDNDGAEPYVAGVSYAVVPRSLFSRHLVRLHSESHARSEARVSRPPGIALLQSFELKFQNGDHHLQRLGVDLDDDQLFVRYRDQNGDDPFSWMVEFGILA